MTVPAKDTNYFHQTLKVLSSTQSAPPLQIPALRAFQRDTTFQSLQEALDTISSLPHREGGGTPSGNVSISGSFQLCFNVIKTQRHWNQRKNVSLKAFYKRSFFHKDICVWVRVYAWECTEAGGRCQASSTVAVHCIYWGKTSHGTRSLSASEVGCPASPLNPPGSASPHWVSRHESPHPDALHGCWGKESELRFSYSMLR